MFERKRWDTIIKELYDMYVNRDGYAYCLGACGEMASSDRVRNLYNYYAQVYAADPSFNNGNGPSMDYDSWLAVNKDKRCFDCSGLIDYVLGYDYHKYSSWNFPKAKINENMSSGVAGSLLWKPGHIGVDCGYGVFIDMPLYDQSLRLLTHRARPDYWQESFECADIDYTGADYR